MQVGPTGEQFTIRHGSTQATVVEVGGGLRTFDVGDRSVVAGFDAFEMAPVGRGQVLIPWPNRTADGRYEWEGRAHQLAINEVERSTAIHGLVRFGAWERVAEAADRIELTHTVWPSPGYPFTLAVRIVYQIAVAALTVTTTTRNVGLEPAPFGAGQHPYLVPPSGVEVDDCVLRVPAARSLTCDARGLPTGSEPVDGTALDFRAGRRIATKVLDTPFTDLERDPSGRATIELEGPEGGSTSLWVDEGYRYVQVFTGDTLPPAARRRSIAIEPMTCPPNAFATGTDLLRLEPGETTTMTWGVTHSSATPNS